MDLSSSSKFQVGSLYKSFYNIPLNKRIEKNTSLVVIFLYLKNISENVNTIELNQLFLKLKLFLNKSTMLDIVSFNSRKNLFFDMGLFINNTGTSIQNYRFNKEITFMNKSIYFFNVDKVLFLLNQFSNFLYKIIGLRGNVLFVSFDSKDFSFINKLSDLWGVNFIVGKWINGLFSNWLYFYRRLWELENKLFNISKERNSILKLNRLLSNKFIGLVGLRSLPDFLFILNSGNGLSIQNLLKESFEFGIPISSIVSINDDPRFIVFPLYGDNNNNLLNQFYKLLLLNFYKLGLMKRILKNSV